MNIIRLIFPIVENAMIFFRSGSYREHRPAVIIDKLDVKVTNHNRLVDLMISDIFTVK